MIDLTVLIKNRSDWTLLLVMINGEIKNLPLSFGHQIEFYKKLMTGLNVTSWFLKFLSYDIDPDRKRKSIQILPFFIFPQNPSHQSEMWISSHWKYFISSLRARSGDKIGENESIKRKQILLLSQSWTEWIVYEVLTWERLAVHLLQEDEAEVLPVLGYCAVSGEIHVDRNT